VFTDKGCESQRRRVRQRTRRRTRLIEPACGVARGRGSRRAAECGCKRRLGLHRRELPPTAEGALSAGAREETAAQGDLQDDQQLHLGGGWSTKQVALFPAKKTGSTVGRKS
jgi:hypothetical protein